MATSDVQICNMALQLIGVGRSIVSLTTDGTMESTKCNEALEPCRKLCLTLLKPPFATKRALITVETTAPTFEYENAFAVPNDYLKQIAVRDGEDEEDLLYDQDYRIEAGVILTDATSIYLIYIYNNTTTTTYDAVFDRVMALAIAMTVGEVLNGNSQKIQAVKEEFAQYRKKAASIESQENPIKSLHLDHFETYRI